MPPTKAEYIAFLEKQKESTQPSIDIALGMIRTAAVSFNHLTGNEHWDRFLSMIQKKLDVAKKEQAEWLQICGSAGAEAVLRDAQLKYQFVRGYVEAFEEAVRLPYQVMESYQEVKKS